MCRMGVRPLRVTKTFEKPELKPPLLAVREAEHSLLVKILSEIVASKYGRNPPATRVQRLIEPVGD